MCYLLHPFRGSFSLTMLANQKLSRGIWRCFQLMLLLNYAGKLHIDIVSHGISFASIKMICIFKFWV